MDDYMNIYLYSVAACAALGLFELVVRLRDDRNTWVEYRLTWGELAVFTLCTFIPAVNVIVIGWPMYSRVWNSLKKVMDKWSKPIIDSKRQKEQQ